MDAFRCSRSRLCGPGERPDIALDLRELLDLSYLQVIAALQIKPVLRRRSKIAGQSQRRIGCNPALGVDDLADPIHRYAQIAAEPIDSDTGVVQVLLQDSAWVNRRKFLRFRFV